MIGSEMAPWVKTLVPDSNYSNSISGKEPTPSHARRHHIINVIKVF